MMLATVGLYSHHPLVPCFSFHLSNTNYYTVTSILAFVGRLIFNESTSNILVTFDVFLQILFFLVALVTVP
jgi:hypothetical protein